jgi:hypothetical protein
MPKRRGRDDASGQGGMDAQIAPGTATPATAIRPVPQAPAKRRHNRIAWILIWLKVAGDAKTAPGTATPPVKPAQQTPARRRQSRIAWSLIGLKAAGDVLRSRWFQELIGVSVIMLAALAHQARESLAQILARLIAWDKQHTPHRQVPARTSQPHDQ